MFEKKIVKTFIDKNDPWYHLDVVFPVKKPLYEFYRREVRFWKNLWFSKWEYVCTFNHDPKSWATNVVDSNY